MTVLELFIVAVGLSMDAFAVSVCKGLAMNDSTLRKAGIVGLWFGAFQAFMPLLGFFWVQDLNHISVIMITGLPSYCLL